MEYWQKVKCFLGVHDWHYYSKFNGEKAYAREARRCRKCCKCEELQFIKLRNWE